MPMIQDRPICSDAVGRLTLESYVLPLLNLWEMLRVQADDIIWAIRFPDRYAQLVLAKIIQPDAPVGEHAQWEILGPELERLQGIYESLGAHLTAKSVATIRSYIQPGTPWRGVIQEIKTFGRLFNDEVGGQQCLLLTRDQAALFSNKVPFGTQFAMNFPNAAEDCIGAAQSYACEQWGACAFYLTRVAERPLKALLKLMAITELDDRPWGTIIDKIDADLNADQRKQPPSSRTYTVAHADTIRSIVGYIQPIKKLRNSRVMHVEDELPDEDVTRRLYRHVEAFACHVAEHLDEQGQFVS